MARHRTLLGILAATSLLLTPGLARAASPPEAEPVSAARSGNACGALDTPETGLQGDVPVEDQISGRAAQGYNCGLALIGHTELGRPRQNGQTAWSGHCAYVATGPGPGGVAVVDVSDPRNPALVKTLHTLGTEQTSETMHAVTTEDRAILVSGLYQGGPNAQMDIYDVSDCESPTLLSTFNWPENIHNLRLSADAKTVFATNPIQAVSITDPRHPVYLGNIEQELLDAGAASVPNHEAVPSPDGTRLYAGSVGGDTSNIIDIEGYPQRPARLVSQLVGPAGQGHSINRFQRDGRTYLVNSSESLLFRLASGCFDGQGPFMGPAQPWVTDITDEHNPQPVGRLTLEINDKANCQAQMQSGVNASSHYHDTYTDRKAAFAVVAMWNAGLRLFDMRNPAQPVEVGYFNPGYINQNLDQAYSHIRYDAARGQLWVTTWNGGFWVLELEPQLRKRLGLRPMKTIFPDGAPARPGAIATPGLSSPAPEPAAALFFCGLGGIVGAQPAAPTVVRRQVAPIKL